MNKKKTLIKLGIIGQNIGNGHPISYSSCFNGYSEKYLKKFCKFKLINQYLPKFHGNKKKNIIQNAKITTIWTQNVNLSKRISKICNIPHISENLEEMSKKVDGVILARDDPENHEKMSKVFIDKKIPIFIDKLITDDLAQYKKMERKLNKVLFMSCSSARFTKHIINAKKKQNELINKTQFVVGFSKENWKRYAHHLLEGIILLFGKNIKKVRCSFSNKFKEVYEMHYQNKKIINLYFFNKLDLPIKFSCHGSLGKDLNVPYIDYFKSIQKMMKIFAQTLIEKKQIIKKKDMFFISKIVLAGILSKKNKGEFFCPKTLKKI